MAASSRPQHLFATPNSDDLSRDAHRQLIGYLGLALPWVLLLMAGLRPTEGLPAWRPLGSVSAYYYTGAVAAFVGLLVALGIFLFAYKGYGNRGRRLDRAAAIVAGVAALLVAFFPTTAPGAVLAPSWWTPTARTLHYAGAIVLFASFAFFSLFLFTRSERPWRDMRRDKRVRNIVHIVCGIGIVASMGWAAVAAAGDATIFWPEVVALELFAVSWLVKGHVGHTLGAAAHNTRLAAGRALTRRKQTGAQE